MKPAYQIKIDDMTANYETIKSELKWEYDLVLHLIALTYTMKEKPLDMAELRDMKGYIKDHTGAFSHFRGVMIYALSGLLCANFGEGRATFDFMQSHEKTMKSVGFKQVQYVGTALYTLASIYEGGSVELYLGKAMEIYKEMRHNHPFLTGGDDYALAILLAKSPHNTADLEFIYKRLDDHGFTKSNGLQMLSHILAFSNKDVSETINKCLYIQEALAHHKLKVPTDYYSAIGLVSLLDIDQDELIADIVEVANYLRDQKKYKWLGKGMNLLIAASLITSNYIEAHSGDVILDATLSVSIQAIIAAQQAAMIATITASTAAATSASS